MFPLKHGQPAVVLAPMEGVTDPPMRALLCEVGGFDLCVAEFLRISQEIPPVRTFVHHMPELLTDARVAAGIPVQLQLLGGDPDKLALAAVAAVQAGATGIDLNFGCPARTVNRRDGGATLLRFPERILLIVRAVRQALPAHIYVSAKLRLGWDDPEAIHVNADMAAQGGAAWITIHGRTRTQGYSPPAYWGPIGQVRKRLGIPVVANGEIWTLDDFRRCRDATQCEHFMLGRGAVANPTLGLQVARELAGAAVYDHDFTFSWLRILQRYVELSAGRSDRADYLPCRLKQWARMSHYRFPNLWYGKLKTMHSLDDMFALLAAA